MDIRARPRLVDFPTISSSIVSPLPPSDKEILRHKYSNMSQEITPSIQYNGKHTAGWYLSSPVILSFLQLTVAHVVITSKEIKNVLACDGFEL